MKLSIETLKKLIKEVLREEEGSRTMKEVEKDVLGAVLKYFKDEIIDLSLEYYTEKLSKIYAYDKNAYDSIYSLIYFKWPISLAGVGDGLSSKIIELLRTKEETKELADEFEKLDPYDNESDDTLSDMLLENIPELKKDLYENFVFEFLYVGTLSAPDSELALDPKIMTIAKSNFLQGLELWRVLVEEKEVEKIIKTIDEISIDMD